VSWRRAARAVRDGRGFSLPELLVSCGVLGLVMAGVAGVLATGRQVSVEGDNRAQAQQTARAAMTVEEELRLAGYDFPAALATFREAAAEARQNAAESRAAHAQQAIDGVRSRHQLMQEAHDATPHAADKRFYGH